MAFSVAQISGGESVTFDVAPYPSRPRLLRVLRERVSRAEPHCIRVCLSHRSVPRQQRHAEHQLGLLQQPRSPLLGFEPGHRLPGHLWGVPGLLGLMHGFSRRHGGGVVVVVGVGTVGRLVVV